MYNLIDLTDRRILVIGASSGIGKRTAITLSRLGAKLVLAAIDEEGVKQALTELEGDGHAAYGLDVSKLDELDDFVKKIVEENGALDGMVYSAGLGTAVPLALSKPEKVQTTFNVNSGQVILVVDPGHRKRVGVEHVDQLVVAADSELFGSFLGILYSVGLDKVEGFFLQEILAGAESRCHCQYSQKSCFHNLLHG